MKDILNLIEFRIYLYLLMQNLLLILCILLMVAYFIVFERKLLGSIQKRRGPNVVGFMGVLQPIADALKLITKETLIPFVSNKQIFVWAPILSLLLSLFNWAIIPLGPGILLADIDLSLLYFFAISSLATYSIILAGWASNSKYSFLGCLRASAQIIAYEVVIGLILLIVLLCSNELNYMYIVISQNTIWGIIPCLWIYFLFLIASLAETNRPPFDLPEAEAELVSGYNVEYSSMSFGFFFLGEYVSILTIVTIQVLLFFGGFWGFLFHISDDTVYAFIIWTKEYRILCMDDFLISRMDYFLFHFPIFSDRYHEFSETIYIDFGLITVALYYPVIINFFLIIYTGILSLMINFIIVFPYLFFSLKVVLINFLFIWVRGSLPRYRYDQLMRLGWKILLPIALGIILLYLYVIYWY